jgi:hypothetical protein
VQSSVDVVACEHVTSKRRQILEGPDVDYTPHNTLRHNCEEECQPDDNTSCTAKLRNTWEAIQILFLLYLLCRLDLWCYISELTSETLNMWQDTQDGRSVH